MPRAHSISLCIGSGAVFISFKAVRVPVRGNGFLRLLVFNLIAIIMLEDYIYLLRFSLAGPRRTPNSYFVNVSWPIGR